MSRSLLLQEGKPKRKGTAAKSSLLLCVVLLEVFVALPTVAQEKRDVGQVPTARYRNGNVDAQWIPYGRRWAIEGTPVTSKGAATMVWGAVRPNRWTAEPSVGRIGSPTGSAAAVPRDYSESCWIKPKGSTGDAAKDTFRLLFKGQNIGETYTVSLRFFEPFPPADLAAWISAAYAGVIEESQRLRSSHSSKPLQRDDVAKIFADTIQRRIQPLIENGEVAWQIRSAVEGHCGLSLSPPPVVISPAQLDSINMAVTLERQNDSIDAEITKIESAIAQFKSRPATPTLRSRLESLAASGKSGLAKGDGDALWFAVQGSEAPVEPVMARIVAFRTSCRNHLAPELCTILGQIHRQFTAYATSHASFVAGTERVERIRRDIALDIQNVFAPVALAQFTSTSWEDAPALSDRLRIGTAISFGMAPLGLALDEVAGPRGDDVYWESFAMFSLKYYFYPVDKSLPDPYTGRLLPRFSVILGVLRSSDLKYEGQKLTNFGGGFTPGVGIAYDLTRDFTVQLGTLFFREQTGSRLGPNDETTARGSLFMSVGVDIDAANRVNSLLKGILN